MSSEEFDNNSQEELEQDVEDFEERIKAIAEPDNIEYTIEKEPEQLRDGRRLSKKDKLIASIEKFRGLLPEIIPTPNKLKKTKIAHLEQLLARCVATASGLQMRETVAEDGDEEDVERVARPTPVPPKINGAEVLYTANIGLVSIIEQISRNTAEYTGVVVDGFSDDLRADKDNLMPILEAVYAEHSTVLSTYLSPSSTWALYMVAGTANHLKNANPPSSAS